MLNETHNYNKFKNRVRLVFGILDMINKRLEDMLTLNWHDMLTQIATTSLQYTN